MLKENSATQESLCRAVCAELGSWRAFTIAVDGIDGAGKTSLACFLGWQIQMPVISTDLYLEEQVKTPAYRLNDLKAAIQSRHSLDRPVIVEGIGVLRTLEQVGCHPDFLIWVDQQDHEAGSKFGRFFEDYRREYDPEAHADFRFEIQPRDDVGCAGLAPGWGG